VAGATVEIGHLGPGMTLISPPRWLLAPSEVATLALG